MAPQAARSERRGRAYCHGAAGAVDCYDWDIEGDVFGLDYSITASDGRSVAAFSKELFHWTDTYHLSVPREEDVLPALLIVLAIDAARCSRGG